MTLTEFGTILDECTGVHAGVQAAWQRMRDVRSAAVLEKFPAIDQRYGGHVVRDAVGLAVASIMLRASAELCYEIVRARGVTDAVAKREILSLMETEQ